MNVSLIWDMDGTLIDSYKSIVERIDKTIRHFGIIYDLGYIRQIIQEESTAFLFKEIFSKYQIDEETLWNYYYSLPIDFSLITLMPHVLETLAELAKMKVNNMIFTHRSTSTFTILETNGIREYFSEVLIADSGFKRKPNPEAINYLVNKYELVKEKTYYVGDRLIDQKCARNARIGSIFYQSYKGIEINKEEYDYKIEDIKDILKLNIF